MRIKVVSVGKTAEFSGVSKKTGKAYTVYTKTVIASSPGGEDEIDLKTLDRDVCDSIVAGVHVECEKDAYAAKNGKVVYVVKDVQGGGAAGGGGGGGGDRNASFALAYAKDVQIAKYAGTKDNDDLSAATITTMASQLLDWLNNPVAPEPGDDIPY